MNRRRSAGFTMVEVLVTVLVLAVGLLGLAGLQAASLRNNYSAFVRSQAVLKTYEAMDRMRANRTVALSGSYNGTFDASYSLPTQTCNNICTDTQMAASDLREWVGAVRRLPGGEAQITVSNTGVATVLVSWNDDRKPGSLLTFRADSKL